MKLSIRQKLALLAGVPVIGAALLSVQILLAASEQLKLAKSLGSVESLVEASVKTTELIHRLEQERYAVLVVVGSQYRERAAAASANAPIAFPTSEQSATDDALQALNQFMASRNEAALPKKFATALRQARVALGELRAIRASIAENRDNFDRLNDYYAATVRSLTGIVAGLTELSNDGELLRLLNPLVALLELEARASAEQALVAYALAIGEFPPGSYRSLVATISEEDIYLEVLQSAASLEVLEILATEVTPAIVEPSQVLRRKVLTIVENDLDVAPEQWLAATRPRLAAFQNVEAKLHDLSRDFAIYKIRRTKQDIVFGTGLAASVVLFSLLFAAALARGITRRLDAMRGAVARVGEGDLKTRVDATNHDELGRLGEAFNQMISEIGQSRILLSEKARLDRDLEIATDIQRAMVPRAPNHPHFEFAGNMLAADEVGGDFYDVLTDGTELWLTIGDVCGHGIGSGLVMLMTQVAFAANFEQDPHAEPNLVWQRVNRILYDNISGRLNDNRYVTAQLLTHRGGGQFRCVGAHQSPIVYRQASGRCELHDSTGPWLGIDRNQSFVPVTELALGPGDVLCLYSDGLPESTDASGDLFDVERLTKSLEIALERAATLKQAADDVFATITAFASHREDDWTLLLVRYRHEGSRKLSTESCA